MSEVTYEYVAKRTIQSGLSHSLHFFRISVYHVFQIEIFVYTKILFKIKYGEPYVTRVKSIMNM